MAWVETWLEWTLLAIGTWGKNGCLVRFQLRGKKELRMGGVDRISYTCYLGNHVNVTLSILYFLRPVTWEWLVYLGGPNISSCWSEDWAGCFGFG